MHQSSRNWGVGPNRMPESWRHEVAQLEKHGTQKGPAWATQGPKELLVVWGDDAQGLVTVCLPFSPMRWVSQSTPAQGATEDPGHPQELEVFCRVPSP